MGLAALTCVATDFATQQDDPVDKIEHRDKPKT
jgi:hypothetical protein